MGWRSDLRCISCGRNQFVSSCIQVVVGDQHRIVITLEGCAAAKCLNCGGEMLFDTTQVENGVQVGPRAIRLLSDEAKARIEAIKVEQYDKTLKRG